MTASAQFGLTPEACRRRRGRLRRVLADTGLDAALITHARHVHYFTGHWQPGRPLFYPALWLPADAAESAILVSADEPTGDLLGDLVSVYSPSMLATLKDDQPGAALGLLAGPLDAARRIGCDEPVWPHLLRGTEAVDIREAIWALRRHKDDDELTFLKAALRAVNAAYDRAREMIRPGVTEIELHAAMHAACIEAIGEPMFEFGNDFQAGSAGGMPRDRAMRDGELAIYDLSAVVRGYSCDVSRTLAVNHQPTDAQLAAHAKVIEALDHVEATVKPGVSCQRLFREVHRMIDGYRGWQFFHHLGHGIGLSAHERPRLNPHWDDTFEVGDVFTAEPGLYGDDLYAGIRIEDNYRVTETGVERLSAFSRGL